MTVMFNGSGEADLTGDSLFSGGFSRIDEIWTLSPLAAEHGYEPGYDQTSDGCSKQAAPDGHAEAFPSPA